MTQLGIPTDVTPSEVIRKATLGAAISLCAEVAGLEPKVIQADLKLDKAQWSRWESGQEGIVWPKLRSVMDRCGNDAPLLWMLHDRGYDLSSLRKRESETERELRQVREQLAREQAERAIERKLLAEVLTGRKTEPA